MSNEYAWRCDSCGSKEVESREWVDLNTGSVSESFDLALNSIWCRKCESEDGASWSQWTDSITWKKGKIIPTRDGYKTEEVE